MSSKRPATTELNHDNWDQVDPGEREEKGTFKTAPREVLEKRVFKTAKRRSQITHDEIDEGLEREDTFARLAVHSIAIKTKEQEQKKSVFSGFGGFNKLQQSSFDFLANLTNGSKSDTDQTTTKTDAAVSSSIFTNKSLSNSPSTIFSMSGSSGFAVKPSFGKSSEGSLFGGTVSPMQSVFTASKADSTVGDSPFKNQASSTATTPELPAIPNMNTDVSTSQVSSTIFGVSSNSSPNKSLSSTNNNLTLFPTSHPVSSTSTTPTSSATTTKADSNSTESNSKLEAIEQRRLTYHSKLKDLNVSVSNWVKKHVEETPLCILSPIFKDYEKYLIEIQNEFRGKIIEIKGEKVEPKSSSETKSVTEVKSQSETKSSPETISKHETKSSPVTNNVSSSIFGNFTSLNSTKAESPKINASGTGSKPSLFNFGINPTVSPNANTRFNIGMNSATPSIPTSVFSVNATNNNTSTPFSFGINKSGLGFNTTTPPNTDTVQESTDEEPPKVEYTPVVEANSVFDIKCKIFIKKDGNFVDKGVGTLYVKKIEESGKHQLLVRANTNLGTVLLNLILSSSIPTQRMGKNNVMLVCIPTPDSKPPPTPILIRVKTAEEADGLLNTLNEYKA